MLTTFLRTACLALVLAWLPLAAADDPVAALAAWDLPQGCGTPNAVLRTVHAIPAPERPALAKRLAAVLVSNASPAAKGTACDALAIIGDADTAAALVPFLTDPVLSPRARNALLPLPDAVTLPLLRAALDQTVGRTRAGLATDLGLRRDTAAIPRLAALAADEDDEVARAALNALGDIGTPAAHQALRDSAARPTTDGARRDALLAVAGRLATQDAATAAAIARPLASHGSIAVRCGAWRILLLTDAAAPIAAVALLGDADARFADAMAGVLATVPAQGIDAAVANTLGSLPDAARDRALTVLVRRRATNCAAAVAALLTPDASAARRIAAISTLGTIGGPDQLAVLIAAAQDADMAVAGAARNALAACPHPGMPAAIGQHLASASEPARTRLALAGAVHRVEAALTHLIPLAGTTGDQAEQARTMLGRHAGPNQYAALARLITAGNGDDGIERMWSELLKRSVDQEAATRILITTHDASRGPARATCMRLLGGIGSSAALATVVKDLHDSDATTVDAAVRALANWSEVEAVPQLLAIATTRDDQTHRTLALRGIVRLAEKPGRTTAQQLDTLRQAWTAVKRPDDVRLLLGAVGRIPSLDALALLEPRIADAAVQDEAVTAWLGIARALDKAKQKTQAVQALDRLIAATSGPLQERAQAEKALLAGNGKGKK